MIKAILYDLDGVLVDACEWHYESLNLALRRATGYEISRSEHISTFNGLPTKTKLDMLVRSGRIQESHCDRVWTLKQEYTIDVIRRKATVDGYKKRLHEHVRESGVAIACVTNSIRKTAELMLECTGQLEYMAFVVSNEDVSCPKPSPEPYLFAMKKLGISPNEAIAVEDSQKGLESATASGANVFHVEDCYSVTIQSISDAIRKFSS